MSLSAYSAETAYKSYFVFYLAILNTTVSLISVDRSLGNPPVTGELIVEHFVFADHRHCIVQQPSLAVQPPPPPSFCTLSPPPPPPPRSESLKFIAYSKVWGGGSELQPPPPPSICTLSPSPSHPPRSESLKSIAYSKVWGVGRASSRDTL